MKSLSTAGNPYEFKILARFRVVDPQKVESRAHRELSAVRTKKEWFRCSLEDATTAILAVAKGDLLGILADADYHVAKQAVTRWKQFLYQENSKKRKLEH